MQGVSVSDATRTDLGSVPTTRLAPLDPPLVRKARGAFFTPPALCEYVADWAIRAGDDLVLEPSCGDAQFLLAAGRRVAALRGGPISPGQLTGVELHEDSAATARRRLHAAGLHAQIDSGDFFRRPPQARHDAVIGNPPYIRYQSFNGDARARSREAALSQGVRLTGLASSWAAFAVHASLFLKPSGRLGLVLPAELLSVNYAKEVRAFLLRRFGRVRLVLFEQRVFPSVQEEVVLLLAEGQGPTPHAELAQLRDAGELQRPASHPRRSVRVRASDKWTPALLPASIIDVYRDLEAGRDFEGLCQWGRTFLGAVTGKNTYFALSPLQARGLGLQAHELVRIAPPGSQHLRATTFTPGMWERLGQEGARTLLFRPAEEPSRAGWRYIEEGLAAGVADAYKCRVRRPWWRVPLAPPADLFLTYMNADTARLATNRAGVGHLNSVHGVGLRPTHHGLGRDLLPLAALNSMTLLGAELVGRAYGGGMLKLEPREADTLPVPSPTLVAAAGPALRRARPRVRRLLGRGALLEAVALVDEVLLGHSRLSRADLGRLRQGHALMRSRRAARGTRAADRDAAVVGSG